MPESARGERHVTFAIPAAPESVGLARKMTDAVLRNWACGVDLDMAILLVDEVFTNAVLHGVGLLPGAARVSVEMVASQQGLHVEVHDPNQGNSSVVAARRSGEHSETGRGLELVDALSACWGAKETPDGKYVYFDMAPCEPQDAPHRSGEGCVVSRPPQHVERGAESQTGVSM
jgi:anti-sigma regulatory factor (Ser/Thr protein kinase)